MEEAREKKAEGRSLPLRQEAAAAPLQLRSGAMKKASPGIDSAAAAAEKEPWSPGTRSERQLLEFLVHGF